MMQRHWLIGATLPFLLMLEAAKLRADEEVTVLAVGDSITQGGSSFRCYREFLIPMLAESETKVRFVGPNRDRFSAHCGYGGRNTSFLSGIIGEVYSKHPADIVLLHSGHNSFSKDEPVPGIVRATEQIVEKIHGLNPDVTILLAQVIPSGKLPKYSYIPELNEELGKSAVCMKAKGIHVILVDLAKDFDWKSDTVADKVHPNESGARKMAERWKSALKPVLDQRRRTRIIEKQATTHSWLPSKRMCNSSLGEITRIWLRQCTKPDTLIVVLGIPYAPAPDLLPQRASSPRVD
jgi:lysophospholipase L1-like esterase